MSVSGLISPRDSAGAKSRRWRIWLLLPTLLLSLLIGIDGIGQPVDDMLRQARNIARHHPASGEIVIIAIDDRSLRQFSRWPWPRRNHAEIIENLQALGAGRIFVNIDFSSNSDAADDARLKTALADLSPRAVLPVQSVVDPASGNRTDILPRPAFRQEVDLASGDFRYNFRGEVWSLPYGSNVGGRAYPSFAAELAGIRRPGGQNFPIDYAISPRTIPVFSAVDVLNQRLKSEQIRGKTVILGGTSQQLGDTYLIPGYGYMSGSYLHALGAETLLQGSPVSLGWVLPFCLTVVLVAGVLLMNERRATLACAAIVALWLLVPMALEHNLIFIDVFPALFLVLVLGIGFACSSARAFYKARGSVNTLSGLPNLDVLRQDNTSNELTLVAAKIQNYAELASALSPEAEKLLVQQIVKRLSAASPALQLYQGDEGVFAWFASKASATAVSEQLNELHQAIKAPMVVDSNPIDLGMFFGVDLGTGRGIANRLASALVAAEEALREGKICKTYDPAKLQDSSWKLALSSQIDHAIDTGALFVEYQPKLCLRTKRIIGAEALARWKHPEKGMISPIDFVLAAEQRGAIGRLTSFVLESAIAAAASLHVDGKPVGIAVNLSGRLIDDERLASSISELLARHRVPANCLTLEITETAALAGSGRSLTVLTEMRSEGIKLSIDDYGTGLSTLDYLKRIPATEIKIDKSFIQAIDKSVSDRLMVLSTVQLAHSLGLTVVAEGVERRATLDSLEEMGCDVAQGYLIGRPMPLAQLRQVFAGQKRAA